MTIYNRVDDLAQFDTPYGRVVRIQEVEFDGGMVLLRMRIREGTRFTDLELTAESATDIADALTSWARSQAAE